MGEFEKDSECVAYALDLWANLIETGDPVLTHRDVVGQLKSLDDVPELRTPRRLLMEKLRVLNDDQMAFVARLRILAGKARGS